MISPSGVIKSGLHPNATDQCQTPLDTPQAHGQLLGDLSVRVTLQLPQRDLAHRLIVQLLQQLPQLVAHFGGKVGGRSGVGELSQAVGGRWLPPRADSPNRWPPPRLLARS